ncbi:MAG: c-type cytochrome biogenesis protein CcmI, partial [Paracoccaceae bacterium]
MSNAWFWGMAVALALAVAAWLIRSMAQDRAPALPSAEADLQIYRDQLAETDRDLTRGTLSPADAARVKTEVARRLLEADRAARAAPAPI